MSICEATAYPLTHSDYQKVEQLAGCDIGHKETSLGDSDDSDADSSSYCSSDERFQMYPSDEFFHFRDVAEGDVIANRPLQSYKVILKDECKPKDNSDLVMFYTKNLEKIVDRRFVSQALHTVGCFGDFSALLTDDEHRKLCGMKEVAKVSNVTYYMHLN